MAGPPMSPLQILRLMTQTSGSSLADKATEIPTLLDGSNQARSNSAAAASGTSGALAGASSPTSVALGVRPEAAPTRRVADVPAHLRRDHRRRVVVGHVRGRFARPHRTRHPSRGRDEHRLSPGQSRSGPAHVGHRASGALSADRRGPVGHADRPAAEEKACPTAEQCRPDSGSRLAATASAWCACKAAAHRSSVLA